MFSLSVHFVFGQTSFILRSNIPDDSLTATQTSKKQVFENLATTSNVNVVELVNFLSCQNNGVVCINLPEVIDTVKFKVKFVESSLNGDFHWYGELLVPDTCVDGQDTVPCEYGHLVLMRQATRYTGSMMLGDSLYYHIRDVGNGKSAIILLNKDSLYNISTCKTPESTNLSGPMPDTATVAAERSSCPVKVLVLYTTLALEQQTDILDLINQSIFETNAIFKNSEVYPHQLELLLAGTAEVTEDVWVETGGDNIIRDLNLAIGDPTLQNIRAQFQADLVVILTGDVYTIAFGAVSSFGDFITAQDSAYTIVHAGTMLDPWFTFPHEIGHLLGCRHERVSDCAQLGDDSGLPEAHGYLIEKKGFPPFLGPGRRFLNTQMAVCNRGTGDDGGLSGNRRILYFSNPDVKYAGKRTGKQGTNNNAKILRNAACRIANYDVSENPIFSLNYPDKACPDFGVNITLDMYGPVPQPWQCTWQQSYDGFNWSVPEINNCSAYNALMPPLAGSRLYVRVTGGNINGPMLTKHIDILADVSETNCPRQDVNKVQKKNMYLNSDVFVLYPNPAENELILGYPQGLTDDVIFLRIYSSQGVLVRQHTLIPSEFGGEEFIRLEGLPQSTYSLIIQTSSGVFRNSFVKIK